MEPLPLLLQNIQIGSDLSWNTWQHIPDYIIAFAISFVLFKAKLILPYPSSL